MGKETHAGVLANLVAGGETLHSSSLVPVVRATSLEVLDGRMGRSRTSGEGREANVVDREAKVVVHSQPKPTVEELTVELDDVDML